MQKIITSPLLFAILLFSILLFSTGTAFSQNPGSEKIKLRLNLKKGDHFTIKYLAQQDISQVIMGTDQNINQTIGLYYSYDVVEATKKSYRLKVTYSRVIFNQEGVTGSTRYDSDSVMAEVPVAAKGFAALTGQSFLMDVTTNGEVTAVEGIDQMLDHMLQSFDNLDNQTRDALSHSLKNQYGDENTRATMQNLMAIYPKKKVGVGDEWKKVATIHQGFPLTLQTTYKIKSIAGDDVTLDVFSEIVSDPDTPMEIMGMKLNYRLAGVQQGETHLDPATGWTKGSKINQDLSGEVTMNSELLPGPQTWPITLVSDYDVRSE
ncbi:MAG: DUF6263 family protein [Bacteroidia bacterium]